MNPFAGWRRVLRAELRAFPRSVAGLLAAALVLAASALFAATVWVGPGGIEDALLFIYVLVPTGFLPLAAARVTQARASRFLQAVFTTPVAPAGFVLGSMLALLALALLYLLTIFPFFAVHAWHVGLPIEVWLWPLTALLVASAGISLGTFIGLLWTGRSSLIALSIGFLLAAWANAGWMFLSNVRRMEPGLMREALLRLLHTSPALLALEATGRHRYALSTTPGQEAVALGLLLLLALAGSIWVFARAQSVTGWEWTIPRAGGLAILVLLSVAAPVSLAGTDYEHFTGYGLSLSAEETNMSASLVPRGAPVAQMLDPPWHRKAWPAEEPVEADILLQLALPRNATYPVHDVRVIMHGERMRLDNATAIIAESGGLTWTFDPLTTDELERACAGCPNATVLRIPVRVTLLDPTNLTRNPYEADVTVTYHLEPKGEPHQAEASIVVLGEVRAIRPQMAFAGALMPLLLVGAALRRTLALR